MDKKVLKRSLVLGALMAFVITGNVWAEEPLTSPWNKAGLESAIASGNGTAKAFIQDTELLIAGPNAAYIVTGNDGTVTGNIDLTARHNPSVEPSGHVAALLLEGAGKDDRAEFTLIGDVTSNVENCNKAYKERMNHCVYVHSFATYEQIGDINMKLENALTSGAGIVAFRMGFKRDEFQNDAKLTGDVNFELSNVVADKVAAVRVANDSELIHKGDVNFYAENYAVKDHGNVESISGYLCRDGGRAELTGNINMTFTNQLSNNELSMKNSIFGAFIFRSNQATEKSEMEHTGDINISFGGKALSLFDDTKLSTIYAYNRNVTNNIYGEEVGDYVPSNTNINTISFGAINATGAKVEFVSDETNQMKWSFANFDVVKVAEDSKLYIDASQNSIYYISGLYAGAKGTDIEKHSDFNPQYNMSPIDEWKIHSAGGAINLGANTMILEDRAKATMDTLVSKKAKITIGEGATLLVKENLNGNATFAFSDLITEKQVYVEKDAVGEYTAEIDMDKLQEGTKIGHVAQDQKGSILDKAVGTPDELYESGRADVENGILKNVQKVIQPTNISVNEMTSLGLMSWRSEMNDMNKRMGELRNAKGEHGVWVRMVRGEDEYKSVKNQYNQYQLGYDEKLSVDKRWTVGVALSYTDAENKFSKGYGESTNKALSIYGSKLNQDGTFIDLIAKYARLENDFKTYSGIGSADCSTNGYSFSAEAGKRIQQGKGLWIEPQVELTYGKVSAVDYVTKQNISVAQDGMESLVGRVGFSIGKDIEQGNVYARASYLYDFDGKTNTIMDGDLKFKEDLGGGWWEVGVGANINLSKATYIYADVEKTFGGEVDTNWQWNLGVRYSF